jgi:hypothetical protein
MNFWHKLFLKSVALIITFFVLFKIVELEFCIDLITSFFPGWHTTIHWFNWLIVPFEFMFLVFIVSLSSYLLYKYVLRFLTYIWLKIFRLHS